MKRSNVLHNVGFDVSMTDWKCQLLLQCRLQTRLKVDWVANMWSVYNVNVYEAAIVTGSTWTRDMLAIFAACRTPSSVVHLLFVFNTATCVAKVCVSAFEWGNNISQGRCFCTLPRHHAKEFQVPLYHWERFPECMSVRNQDSWLSVF